MATTKHSSIASTLADLHRPQRLADVIGQESAVAMLSRQITGGTLPPTLLFEGKPGLGKTTLARILARSVNCKAFDGPTLEPCGECSGCRALDGADGSADVIELNCGEHSGIDSIRDLVESIRLRTLDARVRVVIFDEFQLLSPAARVVLTKPLETPPPDTLFILTTTDVEAVPPAIRSRSQHTKLLPIPRELVQQRLAEVASSMDMAIGTDALYELARASGGSMRDALISLGQFAGLDDEVTLAQVRAALPAISERDTLAMVRMLVDRNPLGLLKVLGGLEADRRNADDITPALGEMLHDLFLVEVLGADSAAEAVSCSPDALVELGSLTGRAAPATVQHWYSLLVDAYTPGNRLLRSDVALEMTLLRMIYEGGSNAPAAPAAGTPAAAEPLAVEIKAEPRQINVPVVERTAEEEQAAEARGALAEQIGWAAVVEQLTSSGAKAAYRATTPLSLADGVLRLKLNSGLFAKHKPAVEAAVLAACPDVSSCSWEA